MARNNKAKAGRRLINGVVVEKPCADNIFFNGQFISIGAISRSQNLDGSYISRILAGNRNPTMTYAIKIASALGITVDTLYHAIQERKHRTAQDLAKIEEEYNHRITQEAQEDIAKVKAGKPVAPRIPGLSLITE